MSLMSWLFPTKKRSRSAPHSGGNSDTPRKASKEGAGSGGSHSARRKGERTARRELLYAVVREAMVRAGVLSASYKFKVLSLDGHGRQYLVMMDLAREFGGGADRLSEIEALIAQSAKSRHDILVTAVYWRLNEHVAVGSAGLQQRARPSQPMPLDSQPAPLHSAPAPLAATAARAPAYEPIQADEVEAFKKALVQGSTGPVPLAAEPVAANARVRAFDGSGHHGPRSYTLLTGYEDTELPDAENKAPLLSGTQYGDLR